MTGVIYEYDDKIQKNYIIRCIWCCNNFCKYFHVLHMHEYDTFQQYFIKYNCVVFCCIVCLSDKP